MTKDRGERYENDDARRRRKQWLGAVASGTDSDGSSSGDRLYGVRQRVSAQDAARGDSHKPFIRPFEPKLPRLYRLVNPGVSPSCAMSVHHTSAIAHGS